MNLEKSVLEHVISMGLYAILNVISLLAFCSQRYPVTDVLIVDTLQHDGLRILERVREVGCNYLAGTKFA